MSQIRLDRFLVLTLLLLVLAVAQGCATTAGPRESVAIAKTETAFDITVPVSRLTLSLPRGDFVVSAPKIASGSTASPRYFIFEDNIRGITLSGWFENARTFPGVKEPPSVGLLGISHKNVAFTKIGAWEVVSYDVLAKGITVANLTAHLVKAGTWIELHLSAKQTRSLEDQRAMIIDVLGSIQVQEKL